MVADLKMSAPSNKKKQVPSNPKKKAGGKPVKLPKQTQKVQCTGMMPVGRILPVGPTPKAVSGKGKYKPRNMDHVSNWWDLAGEALPLLKKGAQLLGFGDYEVKSNSLLAAATDGQMGSQIPQIINSKYSNIVRHREYIGQVLGSTGPFTPTVQPINPGNQALFPWLSIQAKGYQRYRWKGLIFEYIPLSADYAANTAMGYVAFATQYNSLEAAFGNKTDMMQYEFSNEDKPSKVIMHPIECAPEQNTVTEFYVRDPDQAIDGDVRLSDIGKFTYATGGNPAADGYLGDLYATYEIEFFQPKGVLVEGTHMEGSYYTVSAGVANATPLGNGTGTYDSGSTMKPNYANTVLQINPGYKHVFALFKWTGGSVTTASPTTTGSNCTITNVGASGTQFVFPAVAATTFVWNAILTSSNINNGMSVTFGTGGTFPSSATFTAFVCQIPDFSFLPTLKKLDRLNRTRIADNSVAERITPNDILMKLIADGIISMSPRTIEARKETETEVIPSPCGFTYDVEELYKDVVRKPNYSILPLETRDKLRIQVLQSCKKVNEVLKEELNALCDQYCVPNCKWLRRDILGFKEEDSVLLIHYPQGSIYYFKGGLFKYGNDFHP